ncbi:bis(5'-adenosyl)-triphosphatase [Chloropicon primus]|uniref:Bis(5'-adenosyl)-triphosphatase n=1 Tax=Chloropicon primus TaxID=1764295 RepID=A0A5B8MMZ9_9CHLO|nr:bis(5'-adenosyl)-triphosphatase [Chloropicon primus]UPR00636.1 bis(5'-adenosyl)-triphosphatase [Chloropicon primus]|eukprot:QDZ21424.1 bis(5'-adenosyl)-triphosphatase [Chloropicon primus]
MSRAGGWTRTRVLCAGYGGTRSGLGLLSSSRVVVSERRGSVHNNLLAARTVVSTTTGWAAGGVMVGARAFPTEGVDRLFGPWTISRGEIFAESSLSFAFVNLKPVVSGHVLVAPKRVCKRFTELTGEEVADLWQLAKVVGHKLETNAHDLFRGSAGKEHSLTLCIQDGPQAGQTVPHVHVHILPRKEGDFENNDDVYDAIDDGEKSLTRQLDNEERKDRTRQEMEEEAQRFKALFCKP